MFDIDINGKITITKGDTGEFELFINEGTAEEPFAYTLVEGDVVCMYVYQAGCCTYQKDAFIKKEKTLSDVNEEGLIDITLDPRDTASVKPGDYRYRVKLVKASGAVATIIDENSFVIKS